MARNLIVVIVLIALKAGSANATPFDILGPQAADVDAGVFMQGGGIQITQEVTFSVGMSGTISSFALELDLRSVPYPECTSLPVLSGNTGSDCGPGGSAGFNHYVDNLDIILIHDYISILLYSGQNGTTEAIMDATFVDGAPLAPSVGSVVGTFAPIESFGGLIGSDLSGEWTLRFVDKQIQDGTDLVLWRMFGTVTQVPEPGTLALLGVGLFGLGLSKRRKSRSQL